jgi:hypothetical protein
MISRHSFFRRTSEPELPSEEEIAQMRASSADERAAVEGMVLRECSHRWQKVARIVGDLMNEFEVTYPHLPFAMLPATMEKLEDLGKVEIAGDPWAMNYSEIRLVPPETGAVP